MVLILTWLMLLDGVLADSDYDAVAVADVVAVAVVSASCVLESFSAIYY